MRASRAGPRRQQGGTAWTSSTTGTRSPAASTGSRAATRPAIFGIPYRPEEVLDFASRHYRRHVEESNYLVGVEPAADGRSYVPSPAMARRPRLWSIENPPAVVWARPASALPAWLALVPDPEATRDMYHELGGMPADVRALAKRAARIYLGLAQKATK